jgi:hypothetical protein
LELYTRLIEQIRRDPETKVFWYKELDFDPKEYSDKIERRKALYAKFVELIDGWMTRSCRNFLRDCFNYLVFSSGCQFDVIQEIQ